MKGEIFNRSQKETLMDQLGVNKDQINRFNESTNETHSLQEQMHTAQNQVKSLQATQQNIISLGGSYKQDITNEVIAETASQMKISQYEAITPLESSDWMDTGVANRALNKMQTEFNKSFGVSVNLEIPSKSTFEADNNIAYNNSTQGLKDQYQSSIQPIKSHDADSQYNNIISDKNIASNNFKNLSEEQTQNTNNQQNAINTSLDNAQMLHNEKASNSPVTNWRFNNSNNFLQDKKTRTRNESTKREKELAKTFTKHKLTPEQWNNFIYELSKDTEGFFHYIAANIGHNHSDLSLYLDIDTPGSIKCFHEAKTAYEITGGESQLICEFI